MSGEAWTRKAPRVLRSVSRTMNSAMKCRLDMSLACSLSNQVLICRVVLSQEVLESEESSEDSTGTSELNRLAAARLSRPLAERSWLRIAGLCLVQSRREDFGGSRSSEPGLTGSAIQDMMTNGLRGIVGRFAWRLRGLATKWLAMLRTRV